MPTNFNILILLAKIESRQKGSEIDINEDEEDDGLIRMT